jgi:hypothetical protein
LNGIIRTLPLTGIFRGVAQTGRAHGSGP